MAEMEILNREQHVTLRVTRACDAGRHFAQIVADEFPLAAPHYPILFTKHPETGAFYAGVVMGLEPGRNLIAQDGALPDYRPADLERQGFFVADGHIAIDPAHAAFAGGDGQTLFEADGESGPALQRVQRALHMLESGLPATDAIIRRFVALRLLEPIDVTLDFDDGQRLRLDGLYTVSLDALHALPDADALALFRAGDLQLAYAQIGSVRHIRTLARIRNERLLDGAP
jgi:hypothetical protein